MPSAIEIRYALIQLSVLSNREDLVETIRLELRELGELAATQIHENSKTFVENERLKREIADLKAGIKQPTVWQRFSEWFR